MPKMNGKTSITLWVLLRSGWFLIRHVPLDVLYNSSHTIVLVRCLLPKPLVSWSLSNKKWGRWRSVCGGAKVRMTFMESRLESIRTVTHPSALWNRLRNRLNAAFRTSGWIAKQTVKQIRILIQHHFTNLRSTDICRSFSWSLIVPPWGLSGALAVPQKP